MTQGSEQQAGKAPSMARAGFSALVLFASIILLAKSVMAPATNSTDDQQSIRTAENKPSVRPSASRNKARFAPLGVYRMGTRRARTISNPQSEWRPVRIPTEDRAACGVEHVLHEWEPVDAEKVKPATPPGFQLQGKRPAAPEQFQDEIRLVAPRKTKAARKTEPSPRRRGDAEDVRRINRRSQVAGIKPLTRDELPIAHPKYGRQTLIMESPDWRFDGELSDAMRARRARVQQCLDFYYNRPLANMEDSPWSMMHHMIAWGVDSRIIVQKKDGKTVPVSTIGWLCGNGVCDGHKLLYVQDGRLRARVGPALQGHEGQFLAMLAQTRVSRNQVILVDEREFTTSDLIREEQLRCRPRTELTFRLIGLAHYLPVDAKWNSYDGQSWTIDRLVEEELRQPINGTTCGGTHRMMGFTYALARRRMAGLPITGVWAQAQRKVSRHQQMAYQMQNRDGSFSSDFWRSSGDWGDMNRKLKTTGHVLEWMVFSLPPEALEDRRLTYAVDYLTHLLASNRYYDWEAGPLGHAIRALALYDERVFSRRPGKRDLVMSGQRPKLTPRRGSSNVRPPELNQERERSANSRSPFRIFRRR